MNRRLALLGCGVMGESLLKGLLAAGWDPRSVVVAERAAGREAVIRKAYDVEFAQSIPEAMAGAEVVILALKPQDVPEALRDVNWLDGVRRLLISVCAGVPTALLEQYADGPAVVRAMLNTAVSLGRGAIVVAGGESATGADVALAEQILGLVGIVCRVSEMEFDAVTAICGSGPAYLYLLAEAMIEAGVSCGLSHDSAARLTRQTLLGAGILLASSGDSPAVLRQAVTSPAGTTAAAISSLERARFRSTVFDAVHAAAARSREISDLLVLDQRRVAGERLGEQCWVASSDDS